MLHLSVTICTYGRKRFLLASVFGLMSPRVKSLSLGTFSQSTIVLPHFLEKKLGK